MDSNGKLTWTTERRKLADLKPWPRNPRQIKQDQAKRLVDSFSEFGQVETIAIGPGDEVYNGHQRLLVLEQEYGEDYEVDVRVSSRALTEKEREKLTVYLHKGAAGEWDFDVLANEFELDDLLEWGFDKKELDLDLWLPEPPEDPGAQMDRTEELREKWGVETGQLWQLGEHRLICGDCTDKTVIDTVLNGDDYNVLTDPPYNIGFNYESIDDEMTENDYAEFCRQWFNNIIPGAVGAIFSPGPHNEKYYPEARDRGFWIKRNATAGASCFFLRLTEPLLFYGKFEIRRATDVFEYSTGFPDELTAAQRAAGVEDKHPPAKSIPLWEELVTLFDRNKPILDVFLGNGTTLIACERLGRKCRAIEISPAYCAVAIQRWVDMTGGTPVILDGTG